jgi:hypothetical protein
MHLRRHPALSEFSWYLNSEILNPRSVSTPSNSDRAYRSYSEPSMSLVGPSRHFAATQQFSRFRSEADIQRAALTEPHL